MMSKKSPQLRFEGFTDDWEERKLNEVSDIYDGTHQTPKYQDDGVMFLSVENIKTLTSNKFISREAFEDEFKIRPQRGDVLMTRIGDIGTANVVETDEDLAYYVSLALFKSEELNPYFLQASIYAPFVQDQIWKRTLHIAFPKKINKNEIDQVPINVPTLAEQTKIGSFFKQLDNTIALHQRKLDLLKEQKKGYLQKMFPKNGEKVPELRFEGFSGDWEERKLGELLAERNDQIPETNEYPLMSFVQGKGVTPKGDRYNRSFLVKEIDKKYKKTELGDFIYSSNNLETGSIGFNRIGKAVISPVYSIFKSKNEQSSKFIGIMSARKDFISKMTRFRQGVVYGQWRIHESDFLNIDIRIPNDKEQRSIIKFFEKLDDTIALHQRKLDLLREQKKGFLQKMFI